MVELDEASMKRRGKMSIGVTSRRLKEASVRDTYKGGGAAPK